MTSSPPVPADFHGARVMLLEARLAQEAAAMVQRLGGVPVVAPSLAERSIDADLDVTAFLDRLADNPDTVVVLLTGSAVMRLFAAADRLGLGEALASCLAQSVTVARGPKPAGALGRRGVAVKVSVPEPYTTADIISCLDALALEGRATTVVHYGERNATLMAALAARGAVLHELLLYEWRLPEDTAPLSRAIDDLLAGHVAVLVVTSQIQVRHLLLIAGPARRDRLITVLNDRVLVGAVGPTCAATCIDAGICAPFVPDHPKLGPLLKVLAAAHATAARLSESHTIASSARDHSHE